MNQVSLNLIAITIFSLVMASLLGPLINLSPVIPAVAVFGLLSAATIDTLGLQGRFGTLLVAWFANWSPEHRDRVAHHEAGHFLVAHRLGIPVTGYTLNAWDAFRQGQPGLGGVSFDSAELDAQIASGQLSSRLVDQFCIVWMAGIAAETLVYGNTEGGSDDRTTIQQLWTQIKRPATEAEMKQRWATLQAKTLIERDRPTYDALVEAMSNNASLDHCLQILNA